MFLNRSLGILEEVLDEGGNGEAYGPQLVAQQEALAAHRYQEERQL